MQNRAALEAEMEAVLTTATSDHWVEVLEAAGVPCGPVYNYAQMFADPQVRHRVLVQYASDPEFGEVPHIRTPIKIGESVRAATRVNAEQASKRTMCRPTRQPFRGRLIRLGEMSEEYAQLLHRGSGGSMYTRKAHATRETPTRDQG